MAVLDPTFETLLKDVVTAKRLSASKMSKLTEMAMNNMKHDAQLVSMLYRTHNTLPPASKVSSLYVFDALCRAARSHAIKHGLSGNVNAAAGNSATFLSKIESILDGLVEDVANANPPETKEKTKKILDIWAKFNTFSPGVIARLQQVAQTGSGELTKETRISTTPPGSPPPQVLSLSSALYNTSAVPQPSIPPAAAATAPSTLPPTLLALLGASFPTLPTVQTAPGNNPYNPQTVHNTEQTPNAPSVPSALDPAQLAFLQALAEQAKQGNLGGTPPGQSAPPQASPPHKVDSYPDSRSPPHPNEFRNDGRGPHDNHDRSDGDVGRGWNRGRGRGRDFRDSPRGGRGRFNDYRNGEDHRDNHDGDRYDNRGGYRGGPRGGRGRGGGGWGDRRRDDEYGGFSRRGRSRSRSPPPRFRDGDPRPYSPPRRPSLSQYPAQSEGRFPASNEPQPGKDEFGRDIRPESPVSESRSPRAKRKRSDSLSSEQSRQLPAAATPLASSSATILSDNPATQNKAAVPSSSSTANPVQASAAGVGLDKFDFASFDFTSAAAWEGLGKAFEVTNNRAPTQEELMSIVMNQTQPLPPQTPTGPRAGVSGAGSGWQNNQNQVWNQQQPAYTPGRGGRGRGGFRGGGRGRGGRGGQFGGGYYGNEFGNGPTPMGSDDPYGTEAIVLGGESANHGSGLSMEKQNNPAQGVNVADGSASGGGGMKRVGDRWVWQPPQ